MSVPNFLVSPTLKALPNTLLPGRRNVKDKGIIFPELIPSNSPSLLHLSLFLHCQIVVILC